MNPIIEKIRRLRGLARSANVHEAATAAAIADKLIQEHRLDETVLELEGAVRDGPAVDDDPLVVVGRRQLWLTALIGLLGRHYDVACFTRRGHGRTAYCLCGRAEDIALVREMFAWLSSELDHLARASVTGAPSLNSFRLGAVEGVGAQLHDSKRAAMAGNASAALVLASRGAEARAVMLALSNMKPAPPARTVISEAEAFNRGFAAGKDLSLTPQKRLSRGAP